jgi:hypothetical protein
VQENSTSPSVSHLQSQPSDASARSEQPLGRVADAASTGFEGLKTILRLVERATDVFPPLKSAVAGLLGVIDIVEVRELAFNHEAPLLSHLQTTAQNRQDGAELERRLRAIVSIINQHRDESNASSFAHRLDGLST